jgi:predicted Zn-dependent protease
MLFLPRRALLLSLTLAALATGVAACAVNPVSGQQELALLSEADELKLGRENDLQIRKQYGIYPDPRLQAQVQQVGERLAARSHRPQLQYTFTVLDSPQVNAFALPGGYIYITRGILAHLNSEAELAAVLGHEIGHVTARHAVRQYSAALAANIGVAVGSIFVPELGTRAAQTLVNVIGGALLSGYGREHELEADHLGAEYLARTDYDPKAMIEVIGLLKNQELFEKELAARENRAPRVYHGVFATHPSADQRLQEIVAAAGKHRTVTNGRVERDSHLRRLDGLAFGDSTAQGIRRGNEFYHQGLNFALRFPDGWRLDNSPERLLARRPDGDALLEMQVTARDQARTPQEYLVVKLQMRDLRETQAFKVNGSAAYTAVSRLQTPFGARDARVAVVFRDNRAFRFFGATRDAGDGFERVFLDSVRSLHALRPAERPLASGLRLDVITARRGDSFASLARRSPLRHEPESVLRILNDRYPQGEPAPGELIKIVR